MSNKNDALQSTRNLISNLYFPTILCKCNPVTDTKEACLGLLIVKLSTFQSCLGRVYISKDFTAEMLDYLKIESVSPYCHCFPILNLQGQSILDYNLSVIWSDRKIFHTLNLNLDKTFISCSKRKQSCQKFQLLHL